MVGLARKCKTLLIVRDVYEVILENNISRIDLKLREKTSVIEIHSLRNAFLFKRNNIRKNFTLDADRLDFTRACKTTRKHDTLKAY